MYILYSTLKYLVNHVSRFIPWLSSYRSAKILSLDSRQSATPWIKISLCFSTKFPHISSISYWWQLNIFCLHHTIHHALPLSQALHFVLDQVPKSHCGHNNGKQWQIERRAVVGIVGIRWTSIISSMEAESSISVPPTMWFGTSPTSKISFYRRPPRNHRIAAMARKSSSGQ